MWKGLNDTRIILNFEATPNMLALEFIKNPFQ
jgi:hypothetical protein